MCFSPAASLTVGTALSVLGVATVGKVRRTSHLLFASIPLLFGVQQLIEGIIWLSLDAPAVLSVASFLFVLFSHVLWPTVVPLSVFLMEPRPWRRVMLALFVGLGGIVSTYFLFFLLRENIAVQVVHGNITYVAPHFFVTFILSPYTVATCASCLFSSHRFVNVFGIVMFLSAIAAYRLYEHAFVSVWCFFAAALSAIIYLHVNSNTHAIKP